jgi:hypothetical protein
VVAAQLSPFDSPYAPAVVNTYTRAAATDFPVDQTALARFVQGVPADRSADVFETSRSTGFYVLATGHEFLPVGGFSGRVPAPSLAAFMELVAQGRVERVTVTTNPLTNAPDLRWVASHCQQHGSSVYDNEEQAHRSVFYCAPFDAHGPAHGPAHGTEAHRPVPVTSPPQPVGSRGTASPA